MNQNYQISYFKKKYDIYGYFQIGNALHFALHEIQRYKQFIFDIEQQKSLLKLTKYLVDRGVD